MKVKISDIFSSVQGEGKYVGVRQVFVRLFGCNIHCHWCDTPNSIGDTSRHYKEYTIDALVNEVVEQWDDMHSVSLTGGEPMVQSDRLVELIPALKSKGFPIYLETNGIFYRELADIINDTDIIAMDIKLPSSTGCRSFWDEHAEFLKVAQAKDVFIKTVITTDTDPAEIRRAAEMVAKIAPETLFILQPNTYDLSEGVVAQCLAYQKDCAGLLKDVRILPQTHKFMKLK